MNYGGCFYVTLSIHRQNQIIDSGMDLRSSPTDCHIPGGFKTTIARMAAATRRAGVKPGRGRGGGGVN